MDDVRGVVVEYPSGVRLRFAALTVEAAARLLRELGQPAPKVAVPSVDDVRAYLEREATVRPIRTSQVHEALLGRRYAGRGADKATYNAMNHRLRRAAEAIDAAAEWECLRAPDEESGEDTWFLAARRRRDG